MPEPQALLGAQIFLDFRAVHGELSLDPLDEILILGHSSGALSAVEVTARVLARDPHLGTGATTLALVTLGSGLPLVAMQGMAKGSTPSSSKPYACTATCCTKPRACSREFSTRARRAAQRAFLRNLARGEAYATEASSACATAVL